jgi:ATP-dependent helicase/nuclease subunit B
MKGLYAVPLGVPFLPTLVDELITETASNPLELAQYTVLLPTKRGCLMLQEAFQKATPKGCRILPRIVALGDIEEGAGLPGYVPAQLLPPAMPAWQRLGLMTQLVLSFEARKEGGIHNPTRAARLAQELMRLVDEVETTGLSLKNLETFVEADVARHWQVTLDFLKILTQEWPTILQQAGFMEPAARKRLVIEQLAENWCPEGPVILAGTTATRPATARLAHKISNLSNGSVVLAGADKFLFSLNNTSDLKDVVLPTHPQYTTSQLIHYLNKPIQWLGHINSSLSVRSSFVSKAMMPTSQENWYISQEMSDEILSSLQALEMPSIMEEARQIAMVIRCELETPGQSIAVVTPDLELSRRVKASLGKWGIHANLSNGIPLIHSVVGQFLSLISYLNDDIKSADLLALLKHPLYAKGRDRSGHLEQTYRFEIDVLRKLQPSMIHLLPFPGHDFCEPLLKLNDGQLHPFVEFLNAHLKVAEALVGLDDEVNGASLLWNQESGEVGLKFWQALMEHAHHYPPLTGRDYPAFLRHLMAQEIVPDSEGIGSRVTILGSLEARLLEADVVILGGLNEGIWPGMPQEDPWLSRSMRTSFGLPPVERKIGLSAHDFCTTMMAPRIYMTRCLKRDGTPTLPSRWWQRLSAILQTGNAKIVDSAHHTQPWAFLSAKIDEPDERILFTPPSPCPSLNVRPRRLSVTEIETLLQDPYSIYAKKILKLRPLDPLDTDLTKAERGQAIHQVLDGFIRSGVDPSSSKAIPTMESLGREAFGDLLADPRGQAFWWPRFQRLARWFLDQLIKDQPEINKTVTEVDGIIAIPIMKGTVDLSVKADRIDIMNSNQVRIIDYKTGAIPSRKFVNQGYAPQLPLEGVIIKRGGFSNLDSYDVGDLCYWHVTGGLFGGEIISLDNPDALIAIAEQGVQKLFDAFFGLGIPFHACPNPSIVPAYHDYAHLERIKEWG